VKINNSSQEVQLFNYPYNTKRVSERTIDELIGLLKGITADNAINTAEAEFLHGWIKKNRQFCDKGIINTLYVRIGEMLHDGFLDNEEQYELLDLLKSISGEQYQDNQVAIKPATFPLSNPPPVIDVTGAVFCFTGVFAYGPRQICTQATLDKGGIVKNTVTQDTDHLVIGSLCNQDWVHSS